MRFARFALIFAGLISGKLCAADSAAPLTLESALASVEKTNLTVLLSREALVQALEQASFARFAILPTITGSAQQRRSRAVPLTNTGVTAARATNRFDAVMSGSLPVVDLQRWSNIRASRFASEVAQADYNNAVQLVMSSVAQSYFAHLRNLRRLEVLDANISRAR